MPNDVSSGSGGQAGPPPEAKSRRSALFIVFLVVFIDLLDSGIVLPSVAPVYAGERLLKPLFPSEEQCRSFYGLILALLMSAFSAMQFVFAPLWGRISDRVGRRLRVLLIGSGGLRGLLSPVLAFPALLS